MTPSQGTSQDSYGEPRSMLDRILVQLPLTPMSNQDQGKPEESLPCSMIKQAWESNHVVISGQKGKTLVAAKLSSPPATHLVATIEGSSDNVYVDKHIGYTPVTGGTQTLGLVPVWEVGPKHHQCIARRNTITRRPVWIRALQIF